MKSSFLLSLLLAQMPLTAGVINKTYNFTPGQVATSNVTQNGSSYSHVTYTGLDNLTAICEPSIPVKSVLFKVPDNAIDISVSAQASGATTIILPDSISYTLPITSTGLCGVVQRLSTKYPSIRKAAADYQPMVVEGRTWWQATEG